MKNILIFDGNYNNTIHKQWEILSIMDTVIVTTDMFLRIIKCKCCQFNTNVHPIEKLDDVLKIIELHERLNNE